MSTGIGDAKAAIRRAALEARRALQDADQRSAAIAARLRGLAAYRGAGTICWYVGVRDEVRTLGMISDAVGDGRRAAVPWRDGERLALAAIAGREDLEPASFSLLEPSAAVRADPARRVAPAEVDLFVVPGVAFDRRGTRLGYGRGFYDRLLALARADAAIVGLAFEVQVVTRIPAEPHDVPMQLVVTESAVYAPEA
jgi:5-formyltetrahydrofolate cyclo-ligase